MEDINEGNTPTFVVEDFQHIPISEFFGMRVQVVPKEHFLKEGASIDPDNSPIVFGSLDEFKNVPFAKAKLRRIK